MAPWGIGQVDGSLELRALIQQFPGVPWPQSISQLGLAQSVVFQSMSRLVCVSVSFKMGSLCSNLFTYDSI